MHALIERLRRRGFDAHEFSSAGEAAAYLMSLLPKETTIGFGGSVTLRDIGLAPALREAGHTVYWHWEVLGDKVADVRNQAMRADVYVSSANAITQDGVIVNTDGNGNRVAATIYGPKEVFFVIGKNKIVEDFDAAYHRVKNIAAPLNAKRLGTKTPCAVTGKCENCLSPQVMCGATVLLERPTGGRPVHVLMIDEELGY